MKIRILCVGKVKEKYLRDAIDEYMKRMQKFADMEILEVSDEKTEERASETEMESVLSKEGERLIKLIGERDFVTALDIGGVKVSSEGFAEKIKNTILKGSSTLDFVIGGSLGLSDMIKKRADFRLSFSDMTFPHQLMRVILLEQIYRAFKINNNEPYHK